MTDSFSFTLDICWDNFDTPWAALVALWEDFENCDDIVSVKRLLDQGPWPTFEVTTRTVEAARGIVANYLDSPDGFDEEVTEYLREEGIA